MIFEFQPDKLVYGGEALGHQAGRTVLARGVLPGERAEVEDIRTAKGVVHARALRILEPAPERVAPPCPYFGRCGGCQYQHFGNELQVTAKQEILRETLRRLGRINWTGEISVHTSPPWNYRNRAELKVAATPGGEAALGFFETESNRLCPVDACLILSPRLNELLGQLRHPEWSSRLSGISEIEILADDRDERAMLTFRGILSPRDGERLAREALAQLPGAISVGMDDGRRLTVVGEAALPYRVGGFTYRVSARSFFQVSRFLLPELVEAVTAETSGAVAMDLFAGVGLFTLPLARHFGQVIAVEADPRAARDLAANARAHALENVRAVTETVSDFLRRCAQAEADVVVLDPPREGVGINNLKQLLVLRPQRLAYVSCNPPTLARDLGFLVNQGYTLNSLELFDFFPHTYHIESLAKLSRLVKNSIGMSC
ncbi:MAG: class I SAM-dependent RNA methyltransferase [Acidobacteriia bacterium]|nr:class I SAM-dependent RNA methyltransferase [Terriglobia bacterium]